MLFQCVISVIQTIVQILGLSAIILLAYQIHSSTKWNRRSNSQNKINQEYLSEKYTELDKAGINTDCKILEKDDLINIEKNKKLQNICDEILNYLEEFSVAFNMKMIDKKYAYHAHSEDIFKVYDLFKQLIKNRQDKDGLLYSELKKCYDVLKKMDDLEKLKLNIRKFFNKQ